MIGLLFGTLTYKDKIKTEEMLKSRQKKCYGWILSQIAPL